MGVIFSFVMGLAVMILGLMPGACTEGLSLVWGSLLAVDSLDLRLMRVPRQASSFLFFYFPRKYRSSSASAVPLRPVFPSARFITPALCPWGSPSPSPSSPLAAS